MENIQINEPRKNLSSSFLFLFGLALLGIPRVIAHDLNWVEPGSLVNSLLTILPPIIWLVVVLWKKSARPFQSLLFIGICYGVLLGLTHQIFWQVTFDTPPTLGGNLASARSIIATGIPRIFGFLSSMMTGTVMGLILGAIGWSLNRLRS